MSGRGLSRLIRPASRASPAHPAPRLPLFTAAGAAAWCRCRPVSTTRAPAAAAPAPTGGPAGPARPARPPPPPAENAHQLLPHWTLTEHAIRSLARRRLAPFTVHDLVALARDSAADPDRLRAAERFTAEHVAVRLARQILAFRNLPYIVLVGSSTGGNSRRSDRPAAAATAATLPDNPTQPTTPPLPTDTDNAAAAEQVIRRLRASTPVSSDPADALALAHRRHLDSLAALTPWLQPPPTGSPSSQQQQQQPAATAAAPSSPPSAPSAPALLAETLTAILDCHANTLSEIATGLALAGRARSSYCPAATAAAAAGDHTRPVRPFIPAADVNRFLDEHVRDRVPLWLVAEHFIAIERSSSSASPLPPPLPNADPDDSFAGVVDTAMRPASILGSAASLVGDICELRYGIRPRLIVAAATDSATDAAAAAAATAGPVSLSPRAAALEFPYVPAHAEYIFTELLKNAFRATAEFYLQARQRRAQPAPTPGPPTLAPSVTPAPISSPPPVEVMLVPTPEPGGLVVRIRDRGGGIPPAVQARVWEYSFSTFNGDGAAGTGAEPDLGDDQAPPPAGAAPLMGILGPDQAATAAGAVPATLPPAPGHSADDYAFSDHAQAQSTQAEHVPSTTSITNNSIAGMGFGLPLAKVYTQVFTNDTDTPDKASIQFSSLHGWGTDVHVTFMAGLDSPRNTSL